jgi:hypothetical protein
MPTSPIFVGNKSKRLLERAVWNDTSFLAVSSKSVLSFFPFILFPFIIFSSKVSSCCGYLAFEDEYVFVVGF